MLEELSWDLLDYRIKASVTYLMGCRLLRENAQETHVVFITLKKDYWSSKFHGAAVGRLQNAQSGHLSTDTTVVSISKDASGSQSHGPAPSNSPPALSLKGAGPITPPRACYSATY